MATCAARSPMEGDLSRAATSLKGTHSALMDPQGARATPPTGPAARKIVTVLTWRTAVVPTGVPYGCRT
eukprot:9202582-Alexandrium_andersonii.AAC.1